MHRRSNAARLSPRTDRLRRAGPDLAAGLPLLLAAAYATQRLAGLPATYAAQAAALYALLAALVVRYAPAGLPGPGLGTANRITLGRGTLALAIMPLALLPGPLGAPVYWWIIGVSTAAMVLDGFDGRAARRSGTATAFGARFDMELDAALLMALSVLVWRSGRAGPWVLLIGGIRYLFVAAGQAWPALRGPLPPAWRRKAISVVQGVALLVALGPIIPPWLAAAGAGGALALLLWSFAVDARWLLRLQDAAAPQAPGRR